MLQRDYVQGGREDVISPFLDALIEKECDLNYIYGYNEDECFVPIDGQQRLTTLWLLHLYLFARKNKITEFNVHLQFTSREFAEDFSAALQKNIENVMQPQSEDDSFDKRIENQPWFIQAWSSNTSVRNMLGTLKYLHQKITEDNIDSIWEKVVAGSNITFAFLEISKDSGLDDSIYIKMNGRGRELSVFENLKSWMDEQISKLGIAAEWRRKMDNNWTDLFWKNRDESQDHPEEIDDEQLFCFYNLLILYHVYNEDLGKTVHQIKEEQSNLYDELLLFLDKDESFTEDQIASCILNRLLNADRLPLVWIERLKLMPEDFFNVALRWLDSLKDLSDELNKSKVLYVGENPKDQTRLHQLSMSKGSFNRTLPLLYSVLKYPHGNTKFFDWMRTFRNLILNTVISADTLPTVMKAIDKMSEACQSTNLYDALSNGGAQEHLKGFDKRQVDEEIFKSKFSLTDYHDPIVRLENGRFFSGRIGVLFQFLPEKEKDGFDTFTSDHVEAYASILLRIFDCSDGKIKAGFDDERYLLRRALMSFEPYRLGIRANGCWCFCDNMEEWRKFVFNEDTKENNNALRLLIKKILLPAYKTKRDLAEALDDYVAKISSTYEQDIERKDDQSYRYHFIKHPKVWDYMIGKRCMWKEDNNFDIKLKHKPGNNCNRMDLRTESLCLDYTNDKELCKDHSGWTIGSYEEEKTCFYFNREIKDGDSEKTIAIDVLFFHDEKAQNDEDCYSFDLFLRQNDELEENVEQAFAVNQQFFEERFSKIVELMQHGNQDCRYHTKKTYSRSEIISTLRFVLATIKSQTESAQADGNIQ